MKSIGLQLYTVREYLKGDEKIRNLFEVIKNAGYTEIEPFGEIENMELPSQIANEMGLGIAGTISNFNAYKDYEKTVEFCQKYKIKNLGFSASEFNTANEVKKFIDDANAMAEYLDKYGISISYHNHSHEFRKYENRKTAYEMMENNFDKNKIGFVLDTYWIQHGGGDIRHWINKLTGRLTTLHLKDMKRVENNMVAFAPIGYGNLWWDGILEEAYKAGAKHYVVEQDICDKDPIDCIKESAEYLKKYIY